MLRRYRNRSSNRLNRRKSTSSFQAKTESIDPQVARQHAQAAATYAYVRAQGRGSTDYDSARENLLRNNSTASYPGYDYGKNNGGEEKKAAIRPRQSIRFAGPKAVRNRQTLGYNRNRDSTGTEGTAITNEVAVPAVYRPPSRNSSIGRCSFGGKYSEDHLASLVAADEYYTHEDDIASTPSSYRRIQKSRSLTSQLRASDVLFNDGTPSVNRENKGSSSMEDGPRGPNRMKDLRAPKSMSFLRGGRDHLTPSLRQEHDVAVQIARDEFLHQIEQQRLRQQPSFLFKSRARRQEKPFRKTVRSSNNSNDEDHPIMSDLPTAEKRNISIREKARKVSQSFKNKIKGLFKRGVEDEKEKLIPEQPEKLKDVRRPTSNETAENEAIPNSMDSPLLHKRGPTLSQVSSRVPSLHAVPSNRQLRSRTGSVSSLRSTGSSKSRVTSWTASAVDSTANSRHIQAERERQRLSIIQENGAHIPSSSFPRPRLHNQTSPYPPLNQAGSAHMHTAHTPAIIDSQMVYSALMRRLDGTKQRALSRPSQGSMEDLRQQSFIHNAGEFAHSRPSSQSNSTPATIRQVFYEQEDTSPLLERQNQIIRDEDDVFSSDQPSAIPARPAFDQSHRRTSDASTLIVRSNKDTNFQYRTSGTEQTDATPQELASLKKPKSKRLQETTSTFFGASTITISPNSTSPYKKALVESGQLHPRAQFPSTAIYSASRTQFNHSTGSLVGPAYSESIYSRTTSGRTPAPGENDDPPLPNIVSFKKVGTAMALEKLLDDYDHIDQVTSSGQSADWESWMSAPYSALGNEKESALQPDELTFIPSYRMSGHVRENAEIDPDESDFELDGTNMMDVRSIRQSTTSISKLRKKGPTYQLEIPTSLPPPIPMRSPLRTIPSRNSIRSNITTSGEITNSAPPSSERGTISNGRKVLHKRSDSTLRSIENSGKLMKKRSGTQLLPNPGITVAVEKQFGSVGSRQLSYSGVENQKPENGDLDEVYEAGEEVIVGPHHVDAQYLGSQRMRDNFLSGPSRRRAGSDESNAFL